MLTQLEIKNFALIDNLTLHFPAHMTVLTGETGAGKSILIDALGLVLGDRADTHVIKQGQDRCDITAIFQIETTSGIHAWLQAHDLDEHDECLLHRSLSRDGRSRNSINGHPVALHLLRELGNQLVTIHGQHEHTLLFKQEEQRRLLDAYAQNDVLLKDVTQFYRQWKELTARCESLQGNTGENTTRLELLRYHLQELDSLALNEKELVTLEKEYEQLTHAEQLLSSSQTAVQALTEDENASAITALHQAQSALDPYQKMDPRIQNAHQIIQTAIIQTQEASAELRYFLDHAELNPARQKEVAERLDAIYQLARKHKITPDKLYAFHQDLQKELAQLENASGAIAELQKELAAIEKKYAAAASALTQLRQKAAARLGELVTASMQKLGMLHGNFAIACNALARTTPTPEGLDHIEFQVSANRNQALMPLSKVASGGELSRIGLAIHVITAEVIQTSTLIFDEVDTGIGGKTAAIVGKLLRSLGEHRQVICVTHLPQVASCGHAHLQIEKISTRDETRTQVRTLTAKDRVKEIARMLGGLEITEYTIAHAEEMLEKA